MAVRPLPLPPQCDPHPRPRICFATTEYPPHTGGAARSARRLVHGLAARGFDVTVVSAIRGDQQQGPLALDDGPIAVRWVPPDLVAAARVVAEEDAKQPFDLFHGFTLIAAHPCLAAAAVGNRPLVSSIRGLDGVAIDAETIEVLQRSRWVTSVSSDSLRRASDVIDLAQRSCVIPNGIDATGASPWRPTAANRGVVGTVATFRPKKNIPLLIRAYARLPRALRRGLLLVGDAYEANKFVPAAREAIERTIDEVGIRDEATVTGLVDHQHLSEQHQRMGVFALSSDHEGMPNAILEAGSIGLPIVATAVDGVKDVFTDGVDARLVPPGDEAALVAALERVLADDALAHRLSANARQTVSRLTVAAELQRYVDVYEALLAERRAPVDVPQAEGVS